MTTDEKLAILQEWERLYIDLDAQWEALHALTGATTDSPLGDAVWLLWDAYTRQVGERVGGEDSDQEEAVFLAMILARIRRLEGEKKLLKEKLAAIPEAKP